MLLAVNVTLVTAHVNTAGVAIAALGAVSFTLICTVSLSIQPLAVFLTVKI